jgi:glutathione S-transferase
MTDLTLVIGNKNYSSWSLRPWLLMKQTGIPFVERYIPIRGEAWTAQIHRLSPSGKVPALQDGSLQVWDSLAICEYLAERFPEKRLWPTDVAARAAARSVSAEMAALGSCLPRHSHVPVRRTRDSRRCVRTCS